MLDSDPSGLDAQSKDKFHLKVIRDVGRGVSKGRYGAFYWPINWELSKSSDRRKGGLILQRVEVFWIIKDGGADLHHPNLDTLFRQAVKYSPPKALVRAGLLPGNFNLKHAVYWEAWEVKPEAITVTEKAILPDKQKAALEILGDLTTPGLSDLRVDRTKYNEFFFLAPVFTRIQRRGKVIPILRKQSRGSVLLAGQAVYIDGMTVRDLSVKGYSFTRQDKKFSNGTGAGNLLSVSVTPVSNSNIPKRWQNYGFRDTPSSLDQRIWEMIHGNNRRTKLQM